MKTLTEHVKGVGVTDMATGRPADSLSPVIRPRLYEQVLGRLRAHVVAARLRRGDRLPAERELASRLGVSRTSIRQAIVALEVQGLVEVRHGGGIYLLRDDWEVRSPVEVVECPRQSPDVLDARDALETKLAALAARRRTDADLRAIDAALDDMRQAIEAGERGVDADRRFHEAVTAAAHSTVLAAFIAGLGEWIAETRAESLRRPGRPRQALAQHQAVADAIRRRDCATAAAAMHTHVTSAGDLTPSVPMPAESTEGSVRVAEEKS